MNIFSRYQLATIIAAILNGIGLIGILFFDREQFVQLTYINLSVMFVLILYTQQKINTAFILFILITFFVGFAAEIAGTQTGLLFGNYRYNNVLGPQWLNVPIIIGVNWFIIIYCCGVSIHTVLSKLPEPVISATDKPRPWLKAASVIIDGALLAVLFDWIMEPVAVKLGFWTWENNVIPSINYISWFVVSVLLLTVFQLLRFPKQNKFAVNLLLIQAMFFLLLRTFL